MLTSSKQFHTLLLQSHKEKKNTNLAVYKLCKLKIGFMLCLNLFRTNCIVVVSRS